MPQPALVNHAIFSTASGTSLASGTIGWTPTVGNYLVVIGMTRGAGQAQNPSCSDTINGAYTRIFQQFDGSAILDQAICYVKVATGTAPNITYTTGGAAAEAITFSVSEWTDLDPTTIFTSGQDANATGTSTAPAPGSFTNSNTNALLLAWASNTDTSATATLTSPSSPWTVLDSNTNGSTGVNGSVVYQIVSSSAARNPAWTTGSFLWVASQIALNGASPTTTTIAVTDTNLVWSPWNWRPNGSTWRQANNGGARIQGTFNPTTQILANVDVSPLTAATAPSSDYPVLAWSIDGGAWSTTQLTSASTQVSLAMGLTSGQHVIDFRFTAPGTGSPSTDRWTTPALVCRITSFAVDSGAATVAMTVRPKLLMIAGDSISEGFNVDPLTSNAFDSRYSFATHLADALDAEVGMLAFGGQRLCTTTGVAGINVPGLYPTSGTGTWDHYDSTTSRLSGGLFSPQPDYIYVNMGTNDFSAGTTNATFTAQMQGLLNAYRAAAPNAIIIVSVPFNEHYQSAINAVTLDASMHVIDLGAEFAAGFTGTSTNRSADAVHPNAYAAMEAAARTAQLIQAKIGGTSGIRRLGLTGGISG